ncbi:hypothetical protein DL95DRAFT_305651, partial [Leptodontidium sp. 2 PMI_412]
YGNALQAAINEGQEAVVKLLLHSGADVNAQGGHYGNVLKWHYGREVRLLSRCCSIVKLMLTPKASST